MKILICGAGALGSNLAALLACDLKGEHEITVLDMDSVEERNVQAGTQFYTRDQIGLPKVEALQYNIYKWFEREIKITNYYLEPDTVGLILNPEAPISITELGFYPYDLVIDCFDNYEARKLLQDNMPTESSLLHIGFSDQFTFSIEWAENYKVPTDITSGFDICTMQGAASFVKMVSSLGSLVVQDFINSNKKREFVGNKFVITEVR
jgi:hypothetical protein